jgi:hypothetical protein
MNDTPNQAMQRAAVKTHDNMTTDHRLRSMVVARDG